MARVLSQHPPLVGASEKCIDAYNQLLCWFCSPDQSTFYQGGVLTVCDTFCETMYNSCPVFQTAFTTSTDMCVGLGYTVARWELNEPCFNAAPALSSPFGSLAFVLLTAASVLFSLAL